MINVGLFIGGYFLAGYISGILNLFYNTKISGYSVLYGVLIFIIILNSYLYFFQRDK